MKRIDYSSGTWERRVLSLLSQHPDTVSVLDARHVGHVSRKGVDGIWKIRQQGNDVEVPYAIYVAAPWTRTVNFEIA